MTELNKIKEILLDLSEKEKRERKKVNRDYYFYKGRCEDKEKAKIDKELLGQNWEENSNLGYTPTQEVRNKVKPLLKKQARFMFGKEPTISFKAINLKDKNTCEELRQFIDNVFCDDINQFWKTTRKAFLESTIKKRVLLRVEANPGEAIRIKYENIENFSYKEINNTLIEVKFFEEDKNNARVKDEKDKIYYIHKYYYDKLDENSKNISTIYEKLTYEGDNLDKPIEVTKTDTGFSTIPCWLIKNGGELNEEFGETDLEDLKDIQVNYNRTVSDYRDALKFEMFGAEAVIDGNETDVNNFVIAPGALHAVKTDQQAAAQGKQAVVQRIEYSFSSSGAVNEYLNRSEQDMNFILDMPSLKDMNNIPSAKAMKYLYNDLMARCEEKWADWQPIFEKLILFILEAGKSCYGSLFKDSWKSLNFAMLFEHNYPIPSDEEDKKTIGMKEVETGVKSKRSYIKEFTDEEDAEQAYKEILEEKSLENKIDNEEIEPKPNINTSTTDEDEEDESKDGDIDE